MKSFMPSLVQYIMRVRDNRLYKEEGIMKNVTVAATQMACSKNSDDNIKRAEKLVRSAAAEGAQIIQIGRAVRKPIFPPA